MGCERALERHGVLLALFVLRLRCVLCPAARVLREICRNLLRHFLRKLLRIEAELRRLLLFSHSVHPLCVGCLIPARGHPAISGAPAIGWRTRASRQREWRMLPSEGDCATPHLLSAALFRRVPPHHVWHVATGAVGVPVAPEWLLVLLFLIGIAAIGLWWTSTRI